MPNYTYRCESCEEDFDEFREIKHRSRWSTCPKCGNKECKKQITVVNFNEIFPGSHKQQSLADYWTRESVRAQEEGFQSKMELETAIGMAQERAKQMGKPDKQLIGPVESPYKGEKYKPTSDEVGTANELVKRTLKAAHSGSRKEYKHAREALSEHEHNIKQKIAKTSKFQPKHNKEAREKQIKESREARKA